MKGHLCAWIADECDVRSPHAWQPPGSDVHLGSGGQWASPQHRPPRGAGHEGLFQGAGAGAGVLASERRGGEVLGASL